MFLELPATSLFLVNQFGGKGQKYHRRQGIKGTPGACLSSILPPSPARIAVLVRVFIALLVSTVTLRPHSIPDGSQDRDTKEPEGRR